MVYLVKHNGVVDTVQRCSEPSITGNYVGTEPYTSHMIKWAPPLCHSPVKEALENDFHRIDSDLL
jgi:hypothetical protein